MVEPVEQNVSSLVLRQALGATREAASIMGERVILATVSGSHAYGTARPDSDVDVRGVFQRRTRSVLGLGSGIQTYQRDARDGGPDLAAWELSKFVAMATRANPNVLEVLWAPVVATTATGDALRDFRRAFLSVDVARTYGGYAVSQLQSARRGSGGSRGAGHYGSDGTARRRKYLAHVLRLMWQGLHALETGNLDLRVRDPEKMWALADAGLEAVQAEFDALDRRMRAAVNDCALPARPALEVIEHLVVSARIRDLRTSTT